MNPLYRSVQVLFRDEDLLVISKPPRLLTLPDRHQPEKPNLLHFLKEQDPVVMVNHRLDKDTSGILVFTRNPEAHAHLSVQFESRTIIKTYLALVSGRVHADEGTIDQPIGPHPAGDGRMRVHRQGKPSVTHYQVENRFRSTTWLRVNIDTGRTHQIRVHCAFIGHPLAVDPLYGSHDGLYLSTIKTNYRHGNQEVEHPLIDRLTLHASGIRFRHPRTGEEMVFEAPVPKDLDATVKQLLKWGR